MVQPPSDDGRPDPLAGRAGSNPGGSLGWGLFCAGLLWGISHAIRRFAEVPATVAGTTAAILEGVAIAILPGIAGWAAVGAGRMVISIVLARIERESRSDQARLALAERAVAAFERMAEAPEHRPVAESRPVPTGPDRAQLLAELDQAIRSGRRDESESLLEGLAARFPDDPAIIDRRERLDAAHRGAMEDNLARIQAARQVNDTTRVLELYRSLEPSLEIDRRGELERELSRWFLDLIHRRLRGGRIQADVVELATLVAETFSATMEGASLRASLPTLRRSVGLCPRCAQPYTGTAAACPRCLAASTVAPVPAPGSTDAASGPEPDPDVRPPEPRVMPEDGRGDGWIFYDEDDRDDPAPPA